MSQNFQKVQELLAKQFSKPAASITEKTDLVADLAADSLDVVELLMQLEENFNISIPDEKASELHTAGQIAEFIDKTKK